MKSAQIKCSKCKIEKNPDDFSWDKRHKNGHQSWCRECFKKDKLRRKASMRFLGNKMYDRTLKLCSKCNKLWPRTYENWSKNSACPDRLMSYCKHCGSGLFYGLTSCIEREEFRKFQNNKCPMCEGLDLPKNALARLDHDYAIFPCGAGSIHYDKYDRIKYPPELRRSSLRGLLCNKHNGEVAAVDKYFHDEGFRMRYDAYVANPPAQ